MTRIALDSNILVYASADPDTSKGTAAETLIAALAPNGVIPAQALAEFLWVIRRKRPDHFETAKAQVRLYQATFDVVATDGALVSQAADIMERRGLQLWDALICAASLRGGASVLLSEDMQDGADIDGLRVLNPFAPANRSRLQAFVPEGTF